MTSARLYLTAEDVDTEIPSDLLAYALSSGILLFVAAYLSNYAVDVIPVTAVLRVQNPRAAFMAFVTFIAAVSFSLLGVLLVESTKQNGILDAGSDSLEVQFYFIAILLFVAFMHIMVARWIDPTINIPHINAAGRKKMKAFFASAQFNKAKACCKRVRIASTSRGSRNAEAGTQEERMGLSGVSSQQSAAAKGLMGGGNLASLNVFNLFSIPAWCIHALGLLVFTATCFWLFVVLAADHTGFAAAALAPALVLYASGVFFNSIVSNDIDSTSFEDFQNRPSMHLVRLAMVLFMCLYFPFFLCIQESLVAA